MTPFGVEVMRVADGEDAAGGEYDRRVVQTRPLCVRTAFEDISPERRLNEFILIIRSIQVSRRNGPRKALTEWRWGSLERTALQLNSLLTGNNTGIFSLNSGQKSALLVEPFREDYRESFDPFDRRPIPKAVLLFPEELLSRRHAGS
jgi:hypothetical protein